MLNKIYNTFFFIINLRQLSIFDQNKLNKTIVSTANKTLLTNSLSTHLTLPYKSLNKILSTTVEPSKPWTTVINFCNFNFKN